MNENKTKKCTECGKESERIYDGLCIECAYKELMIKTKDITPYIPTYPTLPTYPIYPLQNGWICPKCGRTYNPSQTYCPYCANNGWYQPNTIWCNTTGISATNGMK